LILAIVRREVHGYFVSPIAYTVITGFLLISGYGFLKAIERYTSINPLQFAMEQITIQSGLIWRLNSWANLATLLCLPALSMRLFSEERKGGTIELLLTSPMTTPQLVLGKYLGAMVVYTMIVAMTVPYMIVLGWIGNPDWPAVATTYLGYVLAGLSVRLSKYQFTQGLVDTHDLILNGSLIFLFLFLSTQVLDSSRWR
jgi:ABC-2 type transport system permease protein